MSLYSILRTGVSAMTAQSNKLGTIADNLANTATDGYKRSSAEFSSLLLDSGSNVYNSGYITTTIRQHIGEQGPINYTASSTDLAVQGDGFMVVSDSAGNPFLTRAGAFTVDGATSSLLNAAGYRLMGYDISGGKSPNMQLNSFDNLVAVDVSKMNMVATPTTTGRFSANLPSTASPGATFKSSVVVYDDKGSSYNLDLNFTAADTNNDGTTDGYHLDFGPDSTLGGADLTFNKDGTLSGPSSLTVDTTNPANGVLSGRFSGNIALDLSDTTMLASDYTPLKAEVDGNAPAIVDKLSISDNGTVYADYADGSRAAFYKIPLATVPAPDMLQSNAGTTFSTTIDSGSVMMGFPGEAGRGSLLSGALEQSNVDMATELTDMIIAQRDYTANSKSFQTGSDLLDVLLSLKR